MEKKFKIGYLPLSKVNWTNATLEGQRENALKFLKTLPNVEVLGPDHMLTLEDEAVRQLEAFEQNRPDVLICHFMTFSLGVVPPMFAQRLGIPVILWSMKEPDPNGGRLQNNSFCAANMNAHHMYRLHIPYFHVHAEPGTPDAAEKLTKAINVARTMRYPPDPADIIAQLPQPEKSTNDCVKSNAWMLPYIRDEEAYLAKLSIDRSITHYAAAHGITWGEAKKRLKGEQA